MPSASQSQALTASVIIVTFCAGIFFLRRDRIQRYLLPSNRATTDGAMEAVDAVAGHAGRGEQMMTQHKGMVWKPVAGVKNGVDRGELEAAFYRAITALPETHALRKHVPRFDGVQVRAGDSVSCLVLQDATRGVRRACVLDAKIGRVTYDVRATQEKIAKELKKAPYQAEVKFRISGARLVNRAEKLPSSTRGASRPADDGFTVHHLDREWCLQSSCPALITRALQTFANNGGADPPSTTTARIQQWSVQLNELANAYAAWPSFSVAASSILLIYDADNTDAWIKWIDFAHAYPSEQVDENCVVGMRALRSQLHQVAQLE